jgi:predicted nucleotide-binding protein (sugar kinase/HSP70/actin superfamily)
MWMYLSLVVALAGLLMYGFCTNPKLVNIGLVSFGCGLLAFLMTVGGGHIVGLPVAR